MKQNYWKEEQRTYLLSDTDWFLKKSWPIETNKSSTYVRCVSTFIIRKIQINNTVQIIIIIIRMLIMMIIIIVIIIIIIISNIIMVVIIISTTTITITITITTIVIIIWMKCYDRIIILQKIILNNLIYLIYIFPVNNWFKECTSKVSPGRITPCKYRK